jgi:hypothetical protein
MWVKNIQAAGYNGAHTVHGFMSNQCMTEVVFLTLGQSRSSHFEKIRPLAKGISLSQSFALKTSSAALIVECIKYNLLDFCNCLLVTAYFPFENNRVLL